MTELPSKWLPLLDAVTKQHKLDLDKSGHGPHHWFRVIDIGLTLAKNAPELNIDTDVIIGFGLLHDSARTHDGHCLKHGPESLTVIRELHDLIPLNNDQMLLLSIACVNHTSAQNTDFPIHEPTLHACFDSDRLDLWRVGILPDSRYLFLDVSKSEEIQQWANDNGNNWTIPTWAQELI